MKYLSILIAVIVLVLRADIVRLELAEGPRTDSEVYEEIFRDCQDYESQKMEDYDCQCFENVWFCDSKKL